MAAAELQHVPHHVTLILEGTLTDFLHVVIDGSVEIFCTHDGHETTIDIARPSAAFILASAIRNDIYLSSARTLAPSQILLIPAKQIRDVFDRDPAFARAIALELTEHHRSAVRALMDKKLRTGTERLANWILRTDAMQGNQRTIELTLEKRTLASSLGNDARKSIAKSGSIVEIWGEKLRARNCHRRFVCIGALCKTQYAYRRLSTVFVRSNRGDKTFSQKNAWMPVCARPRISAWMSCVPS